MNLLNTICDVELCNKLQELGIKNEMYSGSMYDGELYTFDDKNFGDIKLYTTDELIVKNEGEIK